MTAPVCDQCGSTTRSGARFCFNCGALACQPVKAFFYSPEPSEWLEWFVLSPKRTQQVKWILRFILYVLLFVGALANLWSPPPVKSVDFPIMKNGHL